MRTLKINLSDSAYEHFMYIFQDKEDIEILEDYKEGFGEEVQLNSEEKEEIQEVKESKKEKVSNIEDNSNEDELLKMLSK